GIAALQPGDHPAALVAERARLVEIGRMAVADETAVALEVREIRAERRGDRLAEVVRRGAECGDRVADLRRQAVNAKPTGDLRRGGEPVADRREVARAAAVEAEPGERAGGVGRRRQRRAELRPEPGV